MNFSKQLARKKEKKTSRVLVFDLKAGELRFVRDKKVKFHDLVLDSMYFDKGVF